jgi:RNA polymerase sigma factor (sigma-70 family)
LLIFPIIWAFLTQIKKWENILLSPESFVTILGFLRATSGVESPCKSFTGPSPVSEARMNVHISYKLPKTPEIEKEIQHWTGKLQKRLQVFKPELVHLKGSVEENSPREGTIVALNLRLPSGQMAVQESAPTPSAAIKMAFDDLLNQVRRHKDLLRSSHRWQRRRSGNGRQVREVPFEETIAVVPPLTASSDDVRSYVNANFRRLRMFVEREVAFREGSAQLEPGLLNWEEVVDEAVACALDESIEKPDRMALEPWLYRLAIRAMDEFETGLAEGLSDVHLESVRRRRNELASDEPHLQFHQPDESMTAESSIADNRVSTPEEIAYSDEMISLVQFALHAAARHDREAFILHAIEGFSLDEIAAITDRSPSQVEQSIRAARDKLRHAFPINNPFKEKLLQHTGAD